MIIAELKLPQLVVPPSVLEQAKASSIEVTTSDVPMGAKCWICCSEAWPHIDPSWPTELFLTVSVVSRHFVGDSKSREPSNDVPAGTLFVVDPMVTHWLRSEERDAPWVGLQWEVPRRRAGAVARKLVAEYAGRWSPDVEPRYAKWRK